MKEPSIRPFPTVERCAAVIILIFISSSIFLTCNAQVIPGLPDLPSVPPTQSASASSSATPSSSIVLPSPSTSPVPSVTPSNTIGLSQNKPQAPASRLPSSTPSPTSSASPLPEFTPLGLDEKLPDISPQPEKKCERNIELPAPTLGTSQLRYALSVVGSAAFVAFASVVYSAAASWETDRTHELFRLSCVILGRLLIVVAIKISASLVASISNSDPEDGALDASGAFLTWASAILTRAYYEAFQMTLRAIGFFEDKFAWDEQLQEYLSPHYEQLTVAAEEPASSIAGTEARSSVQERQEPKLSIVQRLMGGRWDRRLLIAHAFIYIGTEIATLVINLKDFVNSFSHPNERTIFVSSEFAGQCGIMEEDAPVLFGLLTTQVLFLLSQQQSLVPLLTIVAVETDSKRPKCLKKMSNLRLFVFVIFGVWLGSLFCLPIFYQHMYTLFVVGDISLFWQVMIGPPRYTDTGFAIVAAYAIFTTLIGSLIVGRLLYYTKKTSQESTRRPQV